MLTLSWNVQLMLFLLGIVFTRLAASTNGSCTSTQFQCQNQNCISLAWRCDGDDDCHDGSDEKNCPATTCGETDFKCISDGKCIPLRWKCDEANDCHDSSDEDPAVCNQLTCTPEQFRCNDGNCILRSWMCDGEKDCEGGEDENDTCNSTCKADVEFTCGDQQCISKRWKCDQHTDCTDESDEKDCPAVSCREFEFKCANGNCIQDTWVCDGDDDCNDKSDESNCTAADAKCRKSEFQCKTLDQMCIHISWKCDGDVDCEDHSDEKHCNITCSADEFLCEGSEGNYCIHSSLKCDGQNDCLNGSDELNCPVEPLKCKNNTFDCRGDGKQCISYDSVCDKRNDCGNWEDESNAKDGSPCPAENPCLVDNGGCSQICHRSPYGVICDCDKGYHLANNSKTVCEDIDECVDQPGVCSQKCTNTKGSYKCFCISGYTLHDHHRCKANEGQPELLLADRKELRRYQLQTNHYTLLVDKNVSGAIAIDFHFQEQLIFWTDVSEEHIMRVDLQTNQIDVVASENISIPDGLAVDWIHKHLYWTDAGLNHIEVATLNGKMRKILINENLDEPRAIVLDPKNGYMYWSDWGQTPKIEKCGMNGKYRETIISEGITWPNGITIDYVHGRLYWIDAKIHQIGSSDLSGKNQKVILRGHQYLGHPFAISVFEDYLYWSDWPSESVRRYDKFRRGEVETIAQGLHYPMDINVYHKYRQESSENRCQTSKEQNGGCAHFCLPDPNPKGEITFSCECQTGYYVDPQNSKSCLEGSESNATATGPIDSATKSPNHSHQSNKTGITPDVLPKQEEKTEIVGKATPVQTTTIISNTTPKQSPKQSTAGSVRPGITEEISNATEGMPVSKEQKENVGHVALIAIVVVIVICSVLSGIFILIYRRYRRRNIKSMNFDNPVYRKTTMEDHVTMEKNGSRQNLQNSMLQPLNSGEDEIV